LTWVQILPEAGFGLQMPHTKKKKKKREEKTEREREREIG